MNLRAPALRSELNEPQDDGSARRVLLELYRAGLQAVDGERRVADALREDAAHSVAVAHPSNSAKNTSRISSRVQTRRAIGPSIHLSVYRAGRRRKNHHPKGGSGRIARTRRRQE